MENLYIVFTPYQFLICIAKIILDHREGKDEVIICDHKVFPEKWLEKGSFLFKSVTVIKRSKSAAYLNVLLWRNRISRRIPFFYRRLKKYVGFDETFFNGKEIFIFNDFTAMGCLLNISKTKYNLIEDGLNRFQQSLLSSLKTRCRFSKVWDSLLGVSWIAFGQSKYVKSIEVNDGMNLCIKHSNIIVSNRKKMFLSLKENEINLIAEIFDYQPLNTTIVKNSTLLLTQPLSEERLMSRLKKEKLYKFLANEYAVGKLYIKTHPREKDDYTKIFPNAIVLNNGKIPFEIIQLKDRLHFKRVITAFSTAIDAVFCADEKVEMGLEWTLNFK